VAKVFYTPIDMQKLEVRNLRAHVSATDLGSPVGGLCYYNSTTGRLRVYDDVGTVWVEMGSGGGAPDATTTTKGIVQLAGDLTGTAASPQIASGVITDAEVAAANKDGVAGTASLRTLGTGAQQALAGNTRLDTITAPTGPVSLNSQRITSLADPTAAQDGATKAYVDALAQGLSPKDSVRVATTANGALATAYENGDAVDGVTLATGDRILLKDQTTAAENGIYTVNASGAPTRALDFDLGAEVRGATVWVEEGTANADTGWVLTTNAPITIGSTALAFTQNSGLGDVTAGNGLTKTGATLDVNPDNSSVEINADQVRVKALGVTNAMLAGAIDATTKLTGAVPVANGGSGQTTAKTARETGFGAAGYYNNNATHGAGATITITQATHLLRATRALIVQAQLNSDGSVIECDVAVAANGDVTLTFANSQTANTILVTIVG
jgi:Repeat of unknown function (DUF5907)